VAVGKSKEGVLSGIEEKWEAGYGSSNSILARVPSCAIAEGQAAERMEEPFHAR